MTEEWRRSIEKRLQSLELRDAVDEVHRLNVEDRLSGIEEALKWLVQVILGALVTGAIAYLIAGGVALPGKA
ncbi:pseudouridine synthase [Psychromarinibacter sp. C21-152]|uniref:Pseudouridine synthase n=1 Tax=Psychromarinibacter sediminicola TaxID=3033385 RepID=A0AAE3T905_9RHOB|nr:pseudouridine synthase [Psychromarinibacter sediminicola]MDF0601343.1 pseudouridine synthase [Psychromarinibacter sediminicola]